MPRHAYGYGQRSGFRHRINRLHEDGVIEGLRDGRRDVDPPIPELRHKRAPVDRIALRDPLPPNERYNGFARLQRGHLFLRLRQADYVPVKYSNSITVAGVKVEAFFSNETRTRMRHSVRIEVTGPFALTVSQATIAASVAVPVQVQSLTIRQPVNEIISGIVATVTGQSLSVSQADIKPDVTVPVAGQSLTVTSATIAPAVTAPVDPQTALSVSQSDVRTTVVAPVSQALLSVSQATVRPFVEVFIVGQTMTFAALPDVRAMVEVFAEAQSLTVSQATIIAGTVVPVTGQTLTVSQATVTSVIKGWGKGAWGQGAWGE